MTGSNVGSPVALTEEDANLTKYPTARSSMEVERETDVKNNNLQSLRYQSTLSRPTTNTSLRVVDIYGNMKEDQIKVSRQQTRETVLSLLPGGNLEEYEREAGRDGESGPRDGSEFQAIDPELITWDGPDDPENPRNWAPRRKYMATLMVSLYTLISPWSSSAISPAVEKISLDMGITKNLDQALTVSIFVLAWAIAPLIVAPFSEVFGRKRVLDYSLIFLLIFNLACGGAQNLGQLLAFRFVAGLGGAAPLSVGAGSLSDMFDDQSRNRPLAFYALAPTVGPCFGPLISGWISQYLSWRWVFWILGIINGTIAVVCIPILKETYPPALLAAKAKRLRKETGNENLHTLWELSQPSFGKLLVLSVGRPLQMLAVNPIIQGFGLFMAFVYGFMYLALTCFPKLSAGYGFKSGVAGTLYVGPGIGGSIGLFFWTELIQRRYMLLMKRNGGVAKPEYRLFWLPAICITMAVGLFWYGWSAQAHIHWIMPTIGLSIFFFGITGVFQCIQNYLIDMNPKYAASAVGAAAVFRSLFGFGFPLFGQAMYDKLGYGWANSLCAFLDLALGLPFPFFMFYYGERLRKWVDVHVYKEGIDENSKEKEKEEKERKKEKVVLSAVGESSSGISLNNSHEA